jgi:ABC-type uncharacterized transport system permease subunit
LIRNSKFGLGLLAIRDDEDKALAVGVPTRAFKLTAFVVSAVLVGMIGGVYAYYVTYIYQQFVVDPLIGISMVLMVFLVVILLMPRGIVPSVADLVRRWRRRRGPSATIGGSRQAEGPSAGSESSTPPQQRLASP